jgi:hypothetical protein
MTKINKASPNYYQHLPIKFVVVPDFYYQREKMMPYFTATKPKCSKILSISLAGQKLQDKTRQTDLEICHKNTFNNTQVFS